MKPATLDLTQFDSIEGEEIEFGIGDPRWVMRTQAELYSDVTTAIIREYSTNAYDAHVMAGNPDPIRVTLPSMMNNNLFIVEDKGVGMDIETFRKVYTQFGVSDKRELSNTNGMLGYGSKSGLAYTNNFTVTSIKDGVKLEGLVMRKPDWSIVLKVIAHTKTDEPNGTVITIPVHNPDEFDLKAANFFKFWLPGRAVVNGKPTTQYVGGKIAENLYYSKDWNTSYVVMGNVAYRIANPEALFRSTKMSSLNFVAYVDEFPSDDGEQPVEFTPSREDLKYTERTKSTLQAVINQFEADIITTAEAEVNEAKTHAEAFLAWKKWTSTLGSALFSTLEYKGDKFEDKFEVNARRWARNQQYSSYTVQSIRDWPVTNMEKTMVVTECDVNISSAVKAKTNAFIDFKDWNGISWVLFTSARKDDIKSKWIPRDRFVTWADLKAQTPKAPRKVLTHSNNPNAGRISGSWDYFTVDGKESQKPVPTDKTDLYYITVKAEKGWSVTSTMRYAKMKDAAVLLVPANRLAKLLRERPSIKEFATYVQSLPIKDGASLLCEDGKRVMSLSRNTRAWINSMDITKVNDPEIAVMRDLLAREADLLRDYRDNITLAQNVKKWYYVEEYSATEEEYINVTYPLLASLSQYKVSDHVYLYMNAAFEAAKKEKKND